MKVIPFFLFILGFLIPLFVHAADNSIQSRVSLKLAVWPENSGDVLGAGEYEIGKDIVIRANAKEGFVFRRWRGANVADAAKRQTTVYMSENKTLVAEFESIRHVVEVKVVPYGAGFVDGVGLYGENEKVVLTASPALGYEFEGWEGFVEKVNSPSVSFPASGSVSVIAKFSVPKATYRLNINAFPQGSGKVEGSGVYSEGEVRINAIANEGYVFSHWTGSSASISHPSDRDTTVHLGENMTLSAHFIKEKGIVRVGVMPENAGRVDGGGTFYVGTKGTLEAVAYPGYVFSHWRGVVKDTKNPVTEISVKNPEPMSVIAVFERVK